VGEGLGAPSGWEQWSIANSQRAVQPDAPPSAQSHAGSASMACVSLNPSNPASLARSLPPADTPHPTPHPRRRGCRPPPRRGPSQPCGRWGVGVGGQRVAAPASSHINRGCTKQGRVSAAPPQPSHAATPNPGAPAPPPHSRAPAPPPAAVEPPPLCREHGAHEAVLRDYLVQAHVVAEKVGLAGRDDHHVKQVAPRHAGGQEAVVGVAHQRGGVPFGGGWGVGVSGARLGAL
jgi:hypothetical protein